MTGYRTLPVVAATTAFVLLGLLAANAQDGDEEPDEAPSQPYQVQPGDVLRVSVRTEDYFQRDVLVRPDGGISFPLAGDVAAANHTVIEIRDALTRRLSIYIPDPVVTVEVKTYAGDRTPRPVPGLMWEMDHIISLSGKDRGRFSAQ